MLDGRSMYVKLTAVTTNSIRSYALQQQSEPKREERKQESSWNSQSLPRSNSSSRSRSQSPHEARLAQQKRIEQQRGTKSSGQSSQSSYYNQNKNSFSSSSQVWLPILSPLVCIGGQSLLICIAMVVWIVIMRSSLYISLFYICNLTPQLLDTLIAFGCSMTIERVYTCLKQCIETMILLATWGAINNDRLTEIAGK